MREKAGARDSFHGAIIGRSAPSAERLLLAGHFHVECFGADGELKWTDEINNIVVTAGLNEIMDVVLGSGTQHTSWYVGLKNTGTALAADTMGSHSSWTENVTYSNANRVTWTKNGASSGGAMSNSSSPASFSINGSTTIFGAFITSDNTKSGTTGVLFAVGDFASSRAVISGDTLQVTYNLSVADDGV